MSALTAAEALACVNQAVADCGTDATWTRARGGAYDPSTGGVSGGSVEDLPIRMGPLCCVESNFVDGDTICVDDFQACIPGDQTPDLTKGDKITVCGRCYVVLGTKTCQVGCTVVLWTAILRG